MLFENTTKTDDKDLDKITVFDTAHYYYKNLKDGKEIEDIELPKK